MNVQVTLKDTDTLRANGVIVTDAMRRLDGMVIELPTPGDHRTDGGTYEDPSDYARRCTDTVTAALFATHPGAVRVDYYTSTRSGWVQVNGREVARIDPAELIPAQRTSCEDCMALADSVGRNHKPRQDFEVFLR